jgi:hypothetical protein
MPAISLPGSLPVRESSLPEVARSGRATLANLSRGILSWVPSLAYPATCLPIGDRVARNWGHTKEPSDRRRGASGPKQGHTRHEGTEDWTRREAPAATGECHRRRRSDPSTNLTDIWSQSICLMWASADCRLGNCLQVVPPQLGGRFPRKRSGVRSGGSNPRRMITEDILDSIRKRLDVAIRDECPTRP